MNAPWQPFISCICIYRYRPRVFRSRASTWNHPTTNQFSPSSRPNSNRVTTQLHFIRFDWHSFDLIYNVVACGWHTTARQGKEFDVLPAVELIYMRKQTIFVFCRKFFFIAAIQSATADRIECIFSAVCLRLLVYCVWASRATHNVLRVEGYGG